MDCGHQAPLSVGFPRQEYWSGLPFPSPGDLPILGIEHLAPAWQWFQFSSVVQSCPILCDPMNFNSWATLFITNSWSLLKLMSIESVMLSNHLILCHPLLLQPSIVPSIRVSSNESVLLIRWPKYWSFSFSISQDWFPLGWAGCITLRSKGLWRVCFPLFQTFFLMNEYSVQFSHSVESNSLRPHESHTPGLPVHHQFPEFTQTHVHWVKWVLNFVKYFLFS